MFHADVSGPENSRHIDMINRTLCIAGHSSRGPRSCRPRSCRSSRLRRCCRRASALIGLDLGTKTIGVAASDPDRRLAAGVETMARKPSRPMPPACWRLRPSGKQRASLARPAHQHGRQRRPAARSRPVPLRASCAPDELPIGLWDKRLSTVAVERDLIDADVSRKKRAEVIEPARRRLICRAPLDPSPSRDLSVTPAAPAPQLGPLCQH